MDNKNNFNVITEIPDWQISLQKSAFKTIIKNPDQILDFDETMVEIENEL